MRTGNQMTDFLSRVAVFVVMLVCIVGVFGWYLPLIKENQSLREEIAEQEKIKSGLRNDIQAKKKKLISYEYDAKSAERLARENLMYHKPGETIFRFQ